MSLKLLASGVTIELLDLLKIKLHLLRVVGFSDATLRPSASGQMQYVAFKRLNSVPDRGWICVDEMLKLLDASHGFALPPSAMLDYPGPDEYSMMLVGSGFTDALLAIVNQIPNFLTIPFASAKCLLESLLVVIHKHDFDSRSLRHLAPELRKAVRQVLDLSLEDTSYELRQLSISVVQTYVKTRPNHNSNFVA